MYINQVNSTNFQGLFNFRKLNSKKLNKNIIEQNKSTVPQKVSTDVFESMKSLLEKMHSETRYGENKYLCCTEYVKKIRMLGYENISFSNDMELLPLEQQKVQQSKESTLMLDEATKLIIDNQDGKLVHYHKTLTESWDSIMSRADKILKKLLEDYDNHLVVVEKDTLYEQTKECTEYWNRILAEYLPNLDKLAESTRNSH